MEVAVIMAGLTGLGYYLNTDSPPPVTQIPQKVPKPDLKAYQPSSINIYDNNRTVDVRIEEQKLADDMYAKSKNPWETSIVPPYFNSQPGAVIPNPAQFVKPDRWDNQRTKQEPVVEPFHNNMVPFFGGSVKQNTDMNQNSTLFEYQTGTNKVYTHKKESGPLFQPWETRNDSVNGVYDGGDRDTTRFVPAMTQEGIKPFQPVQVGPGLNQGPTSQPSGGYQDFYRPPEPTVDDLRVNPKSTYEGRVLSGQALVTNRGLESQTFKNRPEKAWSQSQDQLLRTTGAVTAPTKRSTYIVRPTNRKCSSAYGGIAGPATAEGQEARPVVQGDRRQTFKTTGPRNAAVPEGWTVAGANGDISDYGKHSITNYKNERTVTGCRTYESNVVGATQRETAPVDDPLKTTRKQAYVTYNRKGNIKIKGIKEHPVSNGEALRTTLKETLIHDSRQGNFNDGTQKITVHDPADVARTTIKETLIHDPHTGNMYAPKKSGGNAYDKDEWRFRTTMKETTPYSKYCNGPKPSLTGAPRTTVPFIDDAKRTIKETTVGDTREGFLDGNKKPTVGPIDKARTTIKETTIDARRTGNINAGLIQQTGGYEIEKYDAKPISRQYISTVEHYNNAMKDMGLGYATNPQNPKDTLRQYTSDTQYFGTAGETGAKAETDVTQYCNAQFNELRERVLKGRAPTQNNTKLALGADSIEMESKHMIPEEDDRDFAPQRTYQVVMDPNACADTKDTIKTSGQIEDTRNDPELLSAFRKNPYTQSLTSY